MIAERVVRPFRGERGMTMIEMLVALFISVVFVVAAGTGYLVNQNSYRRNTEKLRLQQSATYVLEEIEKKIRSGATVSIPQPDRIQVFDIAGNEITRFRLNTIGQDVRLMEKDAVLAQQELINVQFVPKFNGRVVEITVTLEDDNKNRVTMRASAALRNHVDLRNL